MEEHTAPEGQYCDNPVCSLCDEMRCRTALSAYTRQCHFCKKPIIRDLTAYQEPAMTELGAQSVIFHGSCHDRWMGEVLDEAELLVL